MTFSPASVVLLIVLQLLGSVLAVAIVSINRDELDDDR